MTEKRPLCNYSGSIQELGSGDTLPDRLPASLAGKAGQSVVVNSLGDGFTLASVSGGGGGTITATDPYRRIGLVLL